MGYYPQMSVSVTDAPVYPDLQLTIKTTIRRKLIENDAEAGMKIMEKMQELVGDLMKEMGYDGYWVMCTRVQAGHVFDGRGVPGDSQRAPVDGGSGRSVR